MKEKVESKKSNKVLIDDIKSLLVHIANIVNSYKVDLTREESLVRVEKYHRYDRKLINKTMRDPKLFTVENDICFPKKLYSYEYDDNVDIYENRFVASLLVALKKEINDSYIRRSNDSLTFLKAGVSYGRYGTYQILDKYALDSKLDKEDDDRETREILNIINALLSRDFFRKVKLISLQDIIVTNTFIGDEDYAFCYSFYKRGVSRSKDYKESIVKELRKKLTNDKTLNKNNKNLYVYKKDNFVYHLNLENEIRLDLDNKLSERIISYLLDIKVGLFKNHLLIKLEGRETMLDISSVEDILEILDSFSTLVLYKDDRCPVCLKDDKDNKHCNHCNSSYILVRENEKDYAWIYNPFEILLRYE